jgi:GNAT superfamily N-acetyltransferase
MPAPTDLLPRLARAEAAAHALYGASGVAAHFGPLMAVHAGPDLPINTAWHAGTGDLTATDLAAFETFCAGHGQAATVQALSHAAPDLLPLFALRGYALTGLLHVWTRALTDLPEPPQHVQDDVPAEVWAELAARAFGPGNAAMMRLNAGIPGTHRLGAQVEGKPAGVAALSVREGVAALYSAATLPDWRGRGVQTALIAARLRLAARLGADLASVFVRPGSVSERNVRRAGFGKAGARLTFTRA